MKLSEFILQHQESLDAHEIKSLLFELAKRLEVAEANMSNRLGSNTCDPSTLCTCNRSPTHWDGCPVIRMNDNENNQ